MIPVQIGSYYLPEYPHEYLHDNNTIGLVETWRWMAFLDD